jgi:hypothetical protein
MRVLGAVFENLSLCLGRRHCQVRQVTHVPCEPSFHQRCQIGGVNARREEAAEGGAALLPAR